MDFPTATELNSKTVKYSDLRLAKLRVELMAAAEIGRTLFFDYDHIVTSDMAAYLISIGYEVVLITTLYEETMWKISWDK